MVARATAPGDGLYTDLLKKGDHPWFPTGIDYEGAQVLVHLHEGDGRRVWNSRDNFRPGVSVALSV